MVTEAVDKDSRHVIAEMVNHPNQKLMDAAVPNSGKSDESENSQGGRREVLYSELIIGSPGFKTEALNQQGCYNSQCSRIVRANLKRKEKIKDQSESEAIANVKSESAFDEVELTGGIGGLLKLGELIWTHCNEKLKKNN